MLEESIWNPTVFLGERTLRDVDESCVASVPIDVVDRTELASNTELFVYFDRTDQAVIYSSNEQDPLSGTGHGADVYLGSYTLRKIGDRQFGVTIPSDVITYTGIEIGTAATVYWEPAAPALVYNLADDDNPFEPQ